METTTKSREQRWREEAAFFDDWATAVRVSEIPAITLERYTAPSPRRWLHREFRFQVLGDLRGKRVLDLGCGDGGNSALLAKLGAEVVGIDISPQAIEVAKERCRVNGVADRVEFTCGPIETAGYAPDSFDIIWGDGILHHLLDELDLVMKSVARWAKPTGVMLFAEPVNLFPPLRKLRLMLPIPREGTPNERPLEEQDFEKLRPHYARLDVRHFQFFGRIDKFILEKKNYEKSPAWRRAIVNGLSALDYGLLSLPGAKALGSVAIIYGQPAR